MNAEITALQNQFNELVSLINERTHPNSTYTVDRISNMTGHLANLIAGDTRRGMIDNFRNDLKSLIRESEVLSDKTVDISQAWLGQLGFNQVSRETNTTVETWQKNGYELSLTAAGWQPSKDGVIGNVAIETLKDLAMQYRQAKQTDVI
jgi:hypothetical protein